MKLSGLQIFWLMFTFETGNIILLTIGPVMEDAKQDLWISYMIASFLGVFIVYIATKTALLYPKHSLVQFSRLLLGKWLGTLIVIAYLIQWFSVIGNILREFSDFTITILLPTTPPWALNLTMLLLLIYVTYVGGIEGIGRCSEVFGPIIIISVIMLVVLSIKDFDTQNIMPIFIDSGIPSIWKGTLIPLAFFGESVTMLMLVSFMNEPQKAIKSAVWGIAISAFTVCIVSLCVLLVLGPEISAKLRHPTFDVVSYISVMDFVQNIEIIAVLVWILSVFIKLSLYFFLACYGAAQLFNIKNWRKLIWIAAPLFFILAQLYPNSSYTFGYMKTFWVYYALPINMVGIPLLLLAIGSLRKKYAHAKH
ncbi:endospore germination permease [Neobacillus sp. MM2021_6]|uniref:GerAB/ArcD/ProY family transporter n=1 Tax=Bacillaceae TaxID=186817 RepID=UPI00140DEDD0|nr:MULTISPECIES: endospore germination permease [Bacillaceae]MBO0960476.1 endospore germination permease [Neobacillus sp. MM2021_6]